MRILLDTCAFLDLSDRTAAERMPPKIRRLVLDEANDLLLSSVSITELAIETSLGKLAVGEGRLQQLIADLQLTMLPYTVMHARKLYDLPLNHREPFDRMLIATALGEQIPVLSRDGEFRKYKSAGLDLIAY